MFQHPDTDGQQLLGVRYLSRPGDAIENWGIIEGSEPSRATTEDIAEDDPDLLTALKILDLVMTAD